MRLNWNINARARIRYAKVEKGNAVLQFSPWLDMLELINRENMWYIFKYNNKKTV